MACEPFLKSILTGIWWDNDLSYVALRKLQIYDTIALRKARILVAWQNPETFTRQEPKLASPSTAESRSLSNFIIDHPPHIFSSYPPTQTIHPSLPPFIFSFSFFLCPFFVFWVDTRGGEKNKKKHAFFCCCQELGNSFLSTLEATFHFFVEHWGATHPVEQPYPGCYDDAMLIYAYLHRKIAKLTVQQKGKKVPKHWAPSAAAVADEKEGQQAPAPANIS